MQPRQKRMALTLDPIARAALDDMADATGRPASTVAAELLREVAPQLHDSAKIIRLSQAGKTAAAKRALVQMVGSGMASIMAEQLPLPGTKARR